MFYQENGKPESYSLERSSWRQIETTGTFSKKKVKTGVEWTSKLRKPINAARLQRKIESELRIKKYLAAARKYTFLSTRPKSKLVRENGVEFVLVQERVGGKFTGRKSQVTFDDVG